MKDDWSSGQENENSNEMDEMLELEKIAMESLDGTKLNEFYKTKTRVKSINVLQF